MNILVVDECQDVVDMFIAYFKENNDSVIVSNFEKAAQTFKENYVDFVVVNADPQKYKQVVEVCWEIKSTNKDQHVFVMADCYDNDILFLKRLGCHISINPNTFYELEKFTQQVTA
jgi:DNA-binding response OmpR family regulator